MKHNFRVLVGLQLALLALILAGCSAQATPTASPTLPPTLIPTPATYSDAFAYCAAVGTIDAPDARYTGPAISDEIIEGFITAAGLGASTEPMDMFKQTTIWRCMDGQVFACNFGANLPCDSKANTDKNPSAEMADYCKANPQVDFIPMYVTGHDTIYSWRCVQGVAELGEQIAQVDQAGFVKDIWYPISPPANP